MILLMRPIVKNNIRIGLNHLYSLHEVAQGFDAALIDLECFDSVLFKKDRV